MINDFVYQDQPIKLYDEYPSSESWPQEKSYELESINLHKSSQCVGLKKKIKRNRPSVLKIEESGRNVIIYNLIPSSNNLDKEKQL